MKQIVDVEVRLEQGQTQPVLCQADDGCKYVVKCNRAGRRALTAEWIAARLGVLMDLPIPDFEIVELDKQKAALSINEDAASIAKHPAFGSKYESQASELSSSQIVDVDETLRAKVLLFDWWIANGDRTIGNPNLLWIAHERRLIVIDHNLAFDPFTEKNASEFWNQHIFSSDRQLWTPNFKQQMIAKMTVALNQLGTVWNELPEEWVEEDFGVTAAGVLNLLSRFTLASDTFWGAI